MKKMVIIYYSRTGNTEEMAGFIAEGASGRDDIEVKVTGVDDFDVNSLTEYDCIVMGSPTYYGSMAGALKDLLDRTVKFHGQLDGRVGGAFASAANIGGGNETTVCDILNALLVHGMIVQGNPQGDHYGPVSIGKPDNRVKNQCRQYGERLAVLTGKV